MAIRLENSFVIDLPVENTWALLNDIERIAPCVPGARLTEVVDGEYRGSIKVKLGPITAEYKGGASIQEADAAGKRMVVTGKGRDAHGQGAASADMVATMHPDPGGTRVDILTDVQVAGKVAQLGKSVMQDVSARLVDQFVENLRAVAAQNVAPAAEPPVLAEAGSSPVADAPPSSSMADASPAPTQPPPPIAPQQDAIDLLELGGAVMGKRIAWIAGAAAVAVLVVLIVTMAL